MTPRQLARLEQVARLKADRTLKTFAAYRLQMEGMSAEAERLRQALIAESLQGSGASIAEARLANACTRHAALAHLAAEADVARMKPAFEAARMAAQRDFARAEVLVSLRRQALEARRLREQRRG